MKGKFKDFSQFNNKFKNKNDMNETFNRLKVKAFRVSKGSPIVEYKCGSEINEPFKKIHFVNKEINLNTHVPDPLYNSPIPLNFLKYRDILSLVQFVPQNYVEYFKNLPHSTTDFDDDIETI